MMGDRNFRGGAETGFRAGFLGLVGGAVLGACLVAAGGASAYSGGAPAEFSGTEGDAIAIKYSLPTFPHMMRASHSGFAGVRYKLCTADGTARGAPWSWGGEVDPEADYIGVCGLKWELRSNGNYSKRLDIKWNTREDDRVEGDENFWLKLTDPEVLRPGTSSWQSHGGSHHVPLTIKLRLIIRDDD